jgi:hypothetical protein
MLVVHKFLIFLSNSSRSWGKVDKQLSYPLVPSFGLQNAVESSAEKDGEMGKEFVLGGNACGNSWVLPIFSQGFSTAELTEKQKVYTIFPQLIHRKVAV